MVDVKLPTLPPAPIGEATPHHTTRERGGHQKQTASERHTSHLPAPLLRPASPPLLSSPLLPKQEQRDARARHELVEPRRLPRQISRRALVSTRDPRPPSAARRLRPGASPALLPSACALVECSVGRSLFFLLLLLLLWFLSRSHLIYAMPLPTCRSRKENSLSLSLSSLFSGCHLCVDSRDRRWNGITAGGEIAFWCARSWRCCKRGFRVIGVWIGADAFCYLQPYLPPVPPAPTGRSNLDRFYLSV